jgi:hypothetical protein
VVLEEKNKQIDNLQQAVMALKLEGERQFEKIDELEKFMGLLS